MYIDSIKPKKSYLQIFALAEKFLTPDKVLSSITSKL